MPDKNLMHGVRTTKDTRVNTGVRVGSAKPSKPKFFGPKQPLKKPGSDGKPVGPRTAPRMGPIGKKKIAPGKVVGVRGGAPVKGTGFKKSNTTGKPQMIKAR